MTWYLVLCVYVYMAFRCPILGIIGKIDLKKASSKKSKSGKFIENDISFYKIL